MPIISSPSGVTDEDVFIGGVVGFDDLANPANTAAGKASGNLGLYFQATGIADAIAAGTMSSIVSGMAGTGPGETELGLEPASQAEGWFDVYWNDFFTDYGLRPNEINLVINYTLTDGEAELSLSDFVNYVNIARRFGVTSIAPIFSPNGTTYPLDSFATDSYYAEIRAAAIYGGGLTLDIPPNYFFSNTAAYQNFAYQEIQWAQENHIRSTVIISPNGDDSFFLNDAAKLIAYLTAYKAVPTEWVVENYNSSDTDGVGSEQTVNSIANVALYTAAYAPTSRPSGSMTVDILPSTVTAPSLGAGVTVTDTVSTTGINGPVYVSVMDANGGVESYSPQPITLDSNGDATVSAYLEASGDYIRITDSLTSPNFVAYSNNVTIVEPAGTITLSAPGTIQEASPGAGVTFDEMITTTNVANHVDIEVLTSSGSVESGWQVVSLVNGSAEVSVSLDQTGDYVQAQDNETTPTVIADSSPVTITNPVQIITVSAPGTVQETSPGVGVDVVETITATNVTGHVDLEVLTSSGAVESGWQVIPLTNGAATTTVFFANSGDYVYLANSETAPTVAVDSSPVTITDPVRTIAVSAPGTVQEASPGAGLDIVENITTTNITGHVDLEVLTSSGTVESGWQVIALTNGAAATTVYFAHSGDYVHLADSETAPTVTANSSPVTITDASQSSNAAAPTTITNTTRTITTSAPGAVQETSPGGGVTVTESIKTTNITGHVDVEVLTSSGSVESGWEVVPVVNGLATVSVHFAHDGDYIHVADNETVPTVSVNSSDVTITDPVRTITLSSLGTVQEAPSGGGVTVNETIDTTNIVGHVDVEVVTSSGAVESGWQVVPLINGTAKTTVHLAHSGDYIHVADNETAPTVTANSGPVTIAASSAAVADVAAQTSASAALATNAFTISSISLSNDSITIAGLDTTGSAGTMREFLDGGYVGSVTPAFQDGKFTLSIKDVTPGTHQLEFTIDGHADAALYDFTRVTNPSTPAVAIVIPPDAASTGSAAGLLAQLQQNHGAILPTS